MDSVWRLLYSFPNSEGKYAPCYRGMDSNMSSTSSILDLPLHSVLGLPRTEDVLVFHPISVLDGLLGHFLGAVLFGDGRLLGCDGLAVSR